jgi:hypothetical protein
MVFGVKVNVPSCLCDFLHTFNMKKTTLIPHQHQHVLYNDFKNTHHVSYRYTSRSRYFAISAVQVQGQVQVRNLNLNLRQDTPRCDRSVPCMPVEKHRGRRRHGTTHDHTYICFFIATGRTVSRSRAFAEMPTKNRFDAYLLVACKMGRVATKFAFFCTPWALSLTTFS